MEKTTYRKTLQYLWLRRGTKETHAGFYCGKSCGRSATKWKDNIKIDLREVGSKDVNWIKVAQITSNAGPHARFQTAGQHV